MARSSTKPPDDTDNRPPEGLIIERPVLHKMGSVYHAEWQEAGVRAKCRNIREHSDGLTAEITWEFHTAQEGRDNWRVLLRSSINLLSERTRATLGKNLSDRCPLNFDFVAAIDQICILVPDAWRSGEPFLLLDGHAIEASPPFLIERLLPENNTTVIYGDGQTGKSLAAMGMGFSVATGKPYGGRWAVNRPGPVLYLDWETSADDQAFRFRRLRQAYVEKDDDAPMLYYRRMTGPLAQQVEELSQFCEKHGVIFVIVDSLGWATGDELKEAGPAIRVMDAARAIGRTTLFVAHMTKEESRNSGKARGGSIFGSKFFELAARYTWEAVGTDNEIDNSKTLKMFNRKANNVPRSEPIGIRMEFEGRSGPIYISDINLASDPAGPASLSHRIAGLLAKGSATVAFLATATGASEDGVTQTLRRMADRGDVRKVTEPAPGFPGKWGLAAPEFAGAQASAFAPTGTKSPWGTADTGKATSAAVAASAGPTTGSEAIEDEELCSACSGRRAEMYTAEGDYVCQPCAEAAQERG